MNLKIYSIYKYKCNFIIYYNNVLQTVEIYYNNVLFTILLKCYTIEIEKKKRKHIFIFSFNLSFL